jgi:hypothetical protein
MASWALACKNCRAVFTHSQIPDTLAEHFLPTRPEFPPEGLRCECPNCKAEFTYRQHELTSQSDRNRPTIVRPSWKLPI